MWAEQKVSLGKTRDEFGQNKRRVWAKQETSLDKTRDEFGQNKRRDWAKQETRLGKTEGGFEVKCSEQRLLPLDFPFSR